MKLIFLFPFMLIAPVAVAVESWEAGRIDYDDGTSEIAAFINTPEKIQLQIVLCARNEPINYRFSLIFPEPLEYSAFFKVKVSSAGDTTQAFAELNGNTLDFQLDPSVFVNLPDAPDLSIEFEKDDSEFLGIPQILNIPVYGADVTIKQIAAECGYLCVNEDFKCESPLVSAILWPRSGFIDDSVSKLDDVCTRGSDKAYSFNLSDKCKQALDLRFAAIGFEPLSFLDKLFHGKGSSYAKYRSTWNEALSALKTKADPQKPKVEPEIASEVDDYDWYLALYSILGSRKLTNYPASYFAVLDLEEDPTTLLYNTDSRYDVETLKYMSVLLRSSDDNVDKLIEKAISEWRNFYRDLSVSLPLIKEAQALRPLLYRSMLLRLWILAGKPQPIELKQDQMFVQGTDIVEAEQTTVGGQFHMMSPVVKEGYVLFLSAADTTKSARYQERRQTKGFMDETEYPDFYVKLNPFYPVFPKPYSYYQDAVFEGDFAGEAPETASFTDRQLATLVVQSKRGGLRRLDLSKPTLVVDAYDAFNLTADYGLNCGMYDWRTFSRQVAVAYLGDMGKDRHYFLQERYDGKALNLKPGDEGTKAALETMTEFSRRKYHYLKGLDKLYIYTDYVPREQGSWKYEGSDQPEVVIDYRLLPGEGERHTYRDRRYVLRGYAVCTDFYSPDYSQKPLPEVKDHRRTLLWMPDVEFDNNGKPTILSVEAEGITAGGQPVVWKSGNLSK